MLDKVLNDIEGQKLSIWLDGHWSGGRYLFRGKPNPSFIRIKDNRKIFKKI